MESEDSTEHARQKAAWPAKDDNYRTLFHLMDQAYVDLELIRDEHGHVIDHWIIDANPAYERVVGIPLERIRGRPVQQVLPGIKPTWLETFVRIAETGTPERFEREEPEVGRWFDLHVVPSGGDRLQVLLDDISSRKRAEAVLRESEEKQSFLLKLSDALRPLLSPVAIQQAAMEVIGKHMKVNRAFYGDALADNDTLVIGPGYSEGLSPLIGQVKFSDFDWNMLQAYRAGQTVIMEDVHRDARVSAISRAAFDAVQVRAAVGVPLYKDGAVRAIVSLHQAEPRSWTAAEVDLLEETAERTWAAVERAKADERLRESEEALRAREKQQRLTLQLVPATFWWADAAGHFVYADERWTKDTGQTADEVHDFGWIEAIHPDDREATQAAFQHAFATGERLERQQRIRTRNGEYRWHLVRHFPVRNDGGEITRWFGAATDVHQLQELRERQEFLLKLSDALRPVVDSEDIKRTACEILGTKLLADRVAYAEFSPDEQMVTTTGGYLREDIFSVDGSYRTADFDSFVRVLAKGTPAVIRDVYTDQDTEALRSGFAGLGIRAAIASPVLKSGRLVGAVYVHSVLPRAWTTAEIALVGDTVERTWSAVERAQSEAALRQSEERFRLFVDNVREYALVQTDLEGVVTSWNPGAERLLGYASEEIIGHQFALLLPEKDRHDGIIAREMAKLSSGKKNESAHYFQRKDGSRFWCEWITEPVYDDGGKLRGTAKVMRDETERQTAETTIRDSLADKEELLKEVHHRVKNNLQVITSLLNLQAGTVKHDSALSLFQEARNRVQSIAIIHELLYRSASFASIGLRTYATDLIPGLIQAYGMQDRVRAEVLGDGQTIELERAVSFGLLLNELVSNALKHAFPNGRVGTITIRTSSTLDQTVVRVSDDGVGLPHGFDYSRIDSLGLKLVKILVRQLRGQLEVPPSTGAAFQITFPTLDHRKEG